ncbi:MAG: hypothetical protein A2039_05850 [Candidatus Melainabacteria bacterium GWA2_34_9]|nr:MAG: hypothetical protein A2039_05850 [Candidatus Melainabacteria bacterium GWA2_34_9]
MAEGAIQGGNPNWTPAQARLMQNRANQVMAQRNQAINGHVPAGAANSNQIGQMLTGSAPIGQQATSQVVQNDAPPQASAPQLTKQQQRMVEYYQTKIADAGQQAQKTGDYSGIKAIQQEAQQALQQAGIPPEAMQ